MNLRFLPAVLGLALLASCSKSMSSPDTSTQVTTSGGTWMVAYSADPSPVPVNTQFAMTFSLMDAAGMAPDGSAAIAPITTADAYMVMSGQKMSMPSAPTVGTNTDGTIDVTDMFFPMAGNWTLIITITKGSDSETATFTIPATAS